MRHGPEPVRLGPGGEDGSALPGPPGAAAASFLVMARSHSQVTTTQVSGAHGTLKLISR